jgi:diguanylate cyclase (GGDEF)-like protein
VPTGREGVSRDAARSGRSTRLPGQAWRFGVVGTLCTLAYLGLFFRLRPGLGPQAANAVSLIPTAIAYVAAVRRSTFAARPGPGAPRQPLRAPLVFASALLLTSGSLAVLHRLGPAPRSVELLVLADVAVAYLVNAQARVQASATVARLRHCSLHDLLTGLPNRALLEQLLGQAVARARRSRRPAAVLFVDLDGFKPVNDRYGHHVGDQLLAAAAARLTGVMRPGDTLARLAGDEFVVLCEDLQDSAHAESVADRVVDALGGPFHLAHHDISVSASVGIAVSGPGHGIPEALLRDADFAMYQAKSDGGGRHQVFDRTGSPCAGVRNWNAPRLRSARRPERRPAAARPRQGRDDDPWRRLPELRWCTRCGEPADDPATSTGTAAWRGRDRTRGASHSARTAASEDLQSGRRQAES